MATNMKSLNGYGFDATLLGGFAASEYAKKTDIPDNTGVDLLTVYPVGSIYMSVNSASPASLFGGTWAQIMGRYLIGTGAPELNDDGTSPGDYDYAAESKGGEAEHTLTIQEMPSHKHYGVRRYNKGNETGTASSGSSTESGNTTYNTDAAGGGQSHNNMPPYLAVYMWKRVR